MSTVAHDVRPIPRSRMIFGPSLQPALFVLLLFARADTWAWWRAWLLVVVVFVAASVSFVMLLRTSPALLAERLESPLQRAQPFADKVILLAYLVAFAGAVAFIPEDVFHLRIVAPPAPLVSLAGLALVVAGMALAVTALRTNAFAAAVVKHMPERGHAVVDTGVYAVVRHPIYAAGVMISLGIPLWLGSYAATMLALVPIALLGARIHVEERFLRRALPGYTAYADRVLYRLVPGVW